MKGSSRTAARRAVGVAALLGLAVAATACEAGQAAETSVERPVNLGTNAEVGSIELRSVYIEPGTGSGLQQGGTAYLAGTIVNSGKSADVLESVQTGIASSAEFLSSAGAAASSSPSASATASAMTSPSTKPSVKTSTTASAKASPKPSAKASAKASPSASTSASATPSTSASASPTPSAAASGGRQLAQVPLPAGQLLSLTSPEVAGPGPAIRLSGITRDLFQTQTVRVTFNFRTAGSVTMLVPVEVQNGSTATATPLPSETPSPGASLLLPGGEVTPSPSETPAEVPASESPPVQATVVPPSAESTPAH